MQAVNPLHHATVSRGPKCWHLISILLLGVAFGLSGCAYHAGYGDRQIPGGYRTVAVPVFKNLTHETGVETYFTNAMIRELERARIGVITDKDSAQVTLEGIVDTIEYLGAAQEAGKNSVVLNTTVQIVANTTIRLRRNSDQRVLWEASFRKELQYYSPRILIEELSSINASYNYSARNQTLELIASDMMVEAHDRLTENF